MIRYAVALCLAASAAQAQSVRLEGDEIAILLTGNTAVGVWEGANYRQFFGDDGVPIYAQEGSRSTRGNWRVAGDEYQSIWRNDIEWEGTVLHGSVFCVSCPFPQVVMRHARRPHARYGSCG